VRKKIHSGFLLALTLVLLYLVIRKVGAIELLETIQGADLSWILVSIAISPLTILVSVIKWQVLLRSQDIEVPLSRLFTLYLVGRFFNNFMPTTVGGDLVRGVELGRYTKDGASAMASIFVERLTGFIMLILMALFSFLTYRQLFGEVELTIALGVAILGMIFLLWLILDTRPLMFLKRSLKFPLAQKYLPKLEKFHISLNRYRSKKQVLAVAMFWSLTFMILAILNVYSSARAFHGRVPFIEIAIIVPVILIVAMMPLTFNGLGLQEWAYVLLFTWIGLPPTVGLSSIILIRGKDLIMSSLGGLLYPYIRFSNAHLVRGINPEFTEPFLDLRGKE
jgi:glycosyltransferase 2 family protein